MTTYEAVLSAALELPQSERLRLLDRLWEAVPEDEDAPFSEDWKREIEQRVTELPLARLTPEMRDGNDEETGCD